jgi:hypothetical protein
MFPQAEAPPKDYEGPVRGTFLDGKYVPMEFVPEDMIWDKARLDFNIGEELWPEAGIRLAWLQRDRYAVPFGLSYTVDAEHPVSKNDKFEIWIRYKMADTRSPKQKQVEKPYTLKLQLDPDSGEGGMTGYVDLESTNPPLVLRGRFEARFDGVRTPYGVADPMSGSPATLCSLFDKRFREKYPDTKFQILKSMEMRREKTVNKLMRLGYVEFSLLIDKEPTFRSALMVLTTEGWDCAEVLEPWQIPEAFPVLQPQPPPNGGIRSYLSFITATQAQSSISEDDNVFNYKNEFLFGGQPMSWCLSTITYATEPNKKSTVTRRYVLRKGEFGWEIDAEVLPGERFDQKTGEISSE